MNPTKKLLALRNAIRNSPEKKQLVENFFSLSLLQAVNYLLPLITLPYLTRVLGASKFGLIAFAQVFIQYLVVITDYGFNLSATRAVATHWRDRQRLSVIFSAVIMIKSALALLSLALLGVLLVFSDKFSGEWQVFLLFFGVVIGSVLFPAWFFQGVEKMRYVTLLNILAKSIFTIAIFIFVHQEPDYRRVPLLISAGYIIAGLLGFRLALRNFGIYFRFPGSAAIRGQLRDGWHIFLSGLSGNIYGQGTTFILGLLATPAVVGYYSVAERLVKAVANLFQPLAQAIFPFITKRVSDLPAFTNYLRKIAIGAGFLALLLFATVFILAKPLYQIVSGFDAPDGILAFRILSASIFFIILNVVLYPFLVALRADRMLVKWYLLVGLNFVWFCFLFTYLYTYIGTAVSLVIVEMTIFCGSMWMLKKYLGKMKHGK